MARKWVGMAAALLVGLFAWPVGAHEKRADPCGCHHQYGLRHCHMKLKTDKCEAPVSARVRAKESKAKKEAKAPVQATGTNAPEEKQTAGVSL